MRRMWTVAAVQANDCLGQIHQVSARSRARALRCMAKPQRADHYTIVVVVTVVVVAVFSGLVDILATGF